MLLVGSWAVQAQTLVNRAWKSTTGSPKESINHLAGAATYTYVVLVGNTYTVGQEENMLITKYNFSGDILWQTEYNVGDTLSDLGLDVYIEGGYIYVTGASMATDLSTSSMATLKLDVDSGHIQWDTAYAGSYGGITMAGTMVVDSLGNAYVAGSEQTGFMDARLTVVKYNSLGQQQWVMHYDSIGLIDGGAGLALDDTSLVLAGFSGSTFGSWHFVSARLGTATGALQSIRFAPNANGGLEELVNTTQDYEGNTFILGTELAGPGNTDLKLIKYDANFNEQWAVTWGNPDSTDDVPGYLITDSEGNLVVTGSAGNTGGGTDLLTLRYSNVDGSLMWQRRYGAANPAGHAAGYDIATAPPGSSGPLYIAGSTHNGTNLDYLTLSYDLQGNLRWARTMDDTLGSNDEARDIQLSGGGVVVSGISKLPDGTRYVSVKYEEFIKENIAFIDTDSIPQYIDKQIIVWFSPDKVDTSFCADKEKIFTNMGNLIIDTAFLGYLDTLLGGTGKLDNWKVSKVFHNLTPDVKYSISRRGDTIVMPPFWSCFVLHLANGSVVEEVLDSLKTVGVAFIWEVQKNNVFLFNDASSDDEYQNDMQRSLRPSTLDPILVNSSIDIEGAWDIETGRSHVKVGVYDSGINFRHAAFGAGTLQSSNIIGYDWRQHLPLSDLAFLDQDLLIGHGSAVAAIIGAKRNDINSGIAGIAGGNLDGSGVGDANQGVQLVSMILSRKIGECDHSAFRFAEEEDLLNAIVEGASYTEQPNYGYGINIMNMSIGDNQASDLEHPMWRSGLSYANRNQVTICASSGNFNSENEGTAVDDLNFPGTVENDDLLICVGASGINGEWKREGINDGDLRWEGCPNSDHYSSMYGRNVDVIAPGVTGLVYTTKAASNTDFTGFNGTSAATPHASGVAALILSHINSESMTYGNVAPEDVESILQLSATDVFFPPTIVGPDPQSGFGRINATAALELIKLPHRQLVHAPYINTTNTRTSNQVATALEVYVYPNSIEGINVPYCKANVYEVEITYDHSGEITGSATLVTGWRRNSSCKGINNSNPGILGGGQYQNFGCEQIGGIDGTNATYRTYVYELVEYFGAGTWLPMSTSVWFPSLINDATCTYTLLVEDLTATDIEKSPDDEISVRVTPNPANHKAFLRYVLPNKVSNLRVDLYDLSGRVIRNIYTGEQAKGIYSREINIDDLSSGLYFVHLYSEEFSITKKMEKQ